MLSRLLFVIRKDGRLRLIVDARVANSFFRRPTQVKQEVPRVM